MNKLFFMEETWKPIIGYEKLYEISNFGRARALKKSWISYRGGIQTKEKVLLKQCLNPKGYFFVKLSHNGKCVNAYIHTLVWDHFGDKARDGRKILVDHIDNNPSNNRIDNLQTLSQRENIIKGYIKIRKSSKYIGVTWFNRDKNWKAQIYANGVHKHLGYFKCETAAYLCYEKAKFQVENYGKLM